MQKNSWCDQAPATKPVMRVRATKYSAPLGIQLAQFFAALVAVSPQLESHASEHAAPRLVQAVAALSRAGWTNGAAEVEAAVGAQLREIQPSDSADATDVPAELFRYMRVLKPAAPGTGIQWIFLDKGNSLNVVTSIRPDAATCVNPTLLEHTLQSKAEFISPPPSHGGPRPPSPTAFLPGTHWWIKVLHSVKEVGESMPFAIGSGFRVDFVIRPGAEPCVIQLNFNYGGMLVPLGPRR
jgi:hypothetical protein